MVYSHDRSNPPTLFFSPFICRFVPVCIMTHIGKHDLNENESEWLLKYAEGVYDRSAKDIQAALNKQITAEDVKAAIIEAKEVEIQKLKRETADKAEQNARLIEKLTDIEQSILALNSHQQKVGSQRILSDLDSEIVAQEKTLKAGLGFNNRQVCIVYRLSFNCLCFTFL